MVEMYILSKTKEPENLPYPAACPQFGLPPTPPPPPSPYRFSMKPCLSVVLKVFNK